MADVIDWTSSCDSHSALDWGYATVLNKGSRNNAGPAEGQSLPRLFMHRFATCPYRRIRLLRLYSTYGYPGTTDRRTRPYNMKRIAPSSRDTPKTKKRRVEVPDYHLTPSARDGNGEIIWPAPADQIDRARQFILEWSVVS